MYVLPFQARNRDHSRIVAQYIYMYIYVDTWIYLYLWVKYIYMYELKTYIIIYIYMYMYMYTTLKYMDIFIYVYMCICTICGSYVSVYVYMGGISCMGVPRYMYGLFPSITQPSNNPGGFSIANSWRVLLSGWILCSALMNNGRFPAMRYPDSCLVGLFPWENPIWKIWTSGTGSQNLM